MQPFDEAEILKDLREEFLASSSEELDRWEECLLGYEADATGEAANELKRRIHSMKGDAQAVGFVELGALLHEIEEWLQRSERSKTQREIATYGLALVDEIRSYCTRLEDGQEASLDGILSSLRAA